MKKRKQIMALFLAVTTVSGLLLGGCGKKEEADGKVVIELVHYKPEAVDVFDALEEKFNASHDDIKLVIDSPNDAMVILKTRFIRDNNPDIIGDRKSVV